MLYSNLRAISVSPGGSPPYKAVFLSGGEFEADNYGGFFVWNASSTAAASNDWIKPNSLTDVQAGRWQRVRYIPAFGTTAGSICEGDDARIPTPIEQAFLATITMVGDDFRLTAPNNGQFVIIGDLRVEGAITIYDGINTKTITATS